MLYFPGKCLLTTVNSHWALITSQDSAGSLEPACLTAKLNCPYYKVGLFCCSEKQAVLVRMNFRLVCGWVPLVASVTAHSGLDMNLVLARKRPRLFWKKYHRVAADLTLEERTCRNRLFSSCMFGDLGLARWSPPFLFSPLVPPSARLTSWHRWRKAACTPSRLSRADASKYSPPSWAARASPWSAGTWRARSRSLLLPTRMMGMLALGWMRRTCWYRGKTVRKLLGSVMENTIT